MFLVKVKVKSLSHVQLFVTPWTVVHQAPLSMGLSGQDYLQYQINTSEALFHLVLGITLQ